MADSARAFTSPAGRGERTLASKLYRRSTATASMCGEYRNWSIGVTRSSLKPPSIRMRASRASVAGLHETAHEPSEPWTPRARTACDAAPARGGSKTTASKAIELLAPTAARGRDRAPWSRSVSARRALGRIGERGDRLACRRRPRAPQQRFASGNVKVPKPAKEIGDALCRADRRRHAGAPSRLPPRVPPAGTCAEAARRWRRRSAPPAPCSGRASRRRASRARTLARAASRAMRSRTSGDGSPGTSSIATSSPLAASVTASAHRETSRHQRLGETLQGRQRLARSRMPSPDIPAGRRCRAPFAS